MGHVLKTISLSFKSCLTYTMHPTENYGVTRLVVDTALTVR